MELIFNTKTSRGKVTKNARVLSSDATRATINISFSAFVVTEPDTVSKIVLSPAVINFAGDTTKHVVSVKNRGKSPFHLKIVNLPYEDIQAKIKDEAVKANKTGKLEFVWKGKMPEYDINHALTFLAESADTTIRFSVPYVIRGEKGIKPPPVKPPVQAQKQQAKPATSGKPVNKPQVATEKGMRPISKYPMPQQPATVSGKTEKSVKPDSVKTNPNLPASQWPPQ